MKKYKVFTQSLLGLSLFLGSTSLINAQGEWAMATTDHLTITSIKKSKTTPTYDLTQSQDAVKQISHYIKKHVTFPTQLMEFKDLGTMTIEVKINPNGEVAKVYMVKGINKNLDQKVLATLQKLEKIELNQVKYNGNESIQIPIHFTHSF